MKYFGSKIHELDSLLTICILATYKMVAMLNHQAETRTKLFEILLLFIVACEGIESLRFPEGSL